MKAHIVTLNMHVRVSSSINYQYLLLGRPRLVPYSHAHIHCSRLAIPVREVLLVGKSCMSLMDVGQRNINFGLVSKHEQGSKSKSLLLSNESEVPLLYKIVKSGYVVCTLCISWAYPCAAYGVPLAISSSSVFFFMRIKYVFVMQVYCIG